MSNYYNSNAAHLFDTYQSLDPDKLHAGWSQHLPPKPGLALDIGAGSGRDSIWLAQKGWEVIAVEPAATLMELGKGASRSYLVSWIDDCLPGLAKLKEYRQKFSLILVSGVFMHLPQQQRADSLETLTDLLIEDAVLVITLRHGPDSEGRSFYQVSADEFVQFARKRSLQIEVGNAVPDKLGRDDVTWQVIVVKNGTVV